MSSSYPPQLVPGLLAAPLAERWRAAAMPAIRRHRDADDRHDFLPHCSSLRLRAVQAEGLSLEALCQALWRGPLRQLTQRRLGRQVALLADQCWARWQFPLERAPVGHAPHGWHQDGALHADFNATEPPDLLLHMLTCWISLTPCGDDAPGLELLRKPLTGLLSPAALSPSQVDLQHDPAALWRPVMAPGDALLFGGDALHRSHVTPAMRAERISLELRFVAAGDRAPRLRLERQISLAAG